jgi:hypothetical protein
MMHSLANFNQISSIQVLSETAMCHFINQQQSIHVDFKPAMHGKS